MTTFYIKEPSGQMVFTPPMHLEETLHTGFIYSTEGFEDHAKLWVSKDMKLARYIDGWDNIDSKKMVVLEVLQN